MQVRVARAATVTAFVAVSAALYANEPTLTRIWPKLGARTGREFMLTSGLARIREDQISTRQHLAALSLFVLYPAWFELGRALTRRG